MVTSSSGKSVQGVGLAQLLLLTAVVGLVLAMLQGLTHVTSGYGIEDFLGWVDQGAIDQMKALWQDTFARIALPGLHWVPQLYLIIDTAVFMPLYGLLLLAIGDYFAYRVTRRFTLRWAPMRWWVCHQFGALAGVLLLVDYVENAVGFARLDALWMFFVSFVLQLRVRGSARPFDRGLEYHRHRRQWSSGRCPAGQSSAAPRRGGQVARSQAGRRLVSAWLAPLHRSTARHERPE